MEDSRLFRLAAIAAVLSGVFIIGGKILMLLPNEQPGEILDFLSPLCGLFAILGVYLWQRRQAGTFGVAAFIVVFTGLALVTSLDFFGAFVRLELDEAVRDALMESSPGIAFAVSALIFLAGVIMFGVSLIRSGVFPAAAAWLFMVGFVPMTLVEVLPDGVIAATSVVAGLGVLWLGASLWRFSGGEPLETPASPETAPAGV